MKLRNLKISKQLNFAQFIILAVVLIMGIISYSGVNSLWENTEALHDHPFTVQRALASIQGDILNTRLMMEQIVLENGKTAIQDQKAIMEGYDSDAMKQINILYESYLGPKSDIDNAKNLIVDYRSIRGETLNLISAGKLDEARQNVRFDGIAGIQAQKIMKSVAIINTFATNKAYKFYLDSQQQKNQVMIFLIILIAGIFILVSGIMVLLKRSILPPLKELTNAVDQFDQGNLGVKSHYESANELGVLSDAFNKMTERIEMETLDRITKAAELISANKEIASQSKLIKMQEAYYIKKQLLEATLISIGDAVISCDNNGNIIFLNKIAELLTGWDQDDAIGQPIDKVFNIANEVTKEKSENIIKKVILSGEAAELANHTILINKDGIEMAIEDSAAPIFQENGVIVGAVLVFRDVTDKRAILRNIEHLSYHDGLTGLYNRRFYEEELKRMDTGRNLPLTIVMGDVNGLKLINDSFGHTTGDELLQKAAIAIKKGCRADDIIARLGGDEFIAILPNTDVVETETIINRIKNIVSKEKVKELEISISFGYGTKEDARTTVQDIFKIAEDNMYQNKLYESSSMRSKTVDLIMSTLYEKNNREMLHSKRVSEISENIAKELNFDRDQVKQIRMAGLIHDIGKIGIIEEILNKNGKLEDNEYTEIKRHPEIGYRILSAVREFSEMSNFILAHHERWDGKGYPRGLKGVDIPIQSRIIALADAYDAMISNRTYKKELSKDEAIEEIKRCSGTQFDPDIARVFIYQVLGTQSTEAEE